jgi:hypothetical protein
MTDYKTIVTEKPENGFDTKVEYYNAWGHKKPAWARFTKNSDTVDLIHIRRNGDFSGLFMRVNILTLVKEYRPRLCEEYLSLAEATMGGIRRDHD